MELKYIFKKLNKNKAVIYIGLLAGAIIGCIIYFLPMNYKAQGSFYINRDIQLSQDGSFSYEGYYSQQVAISLTKTVAALIESPDIGYKVLNRQNLNLTENALRTYRKNTRVITSGPQLLTLETRAKNPDNAKALWEAVASSLEDSLNTSFVQIKRVSEVPIVTEAYKNLPLFIILGGITGVGLSIILITGKEYFS